MNGPRTKLVSLVVASTALVAVSVGCGRDEVDLANGKKLFTERQCGSCHALARANAKGTQGPDLDVAFGPSRRAGMNAETVEGVVLDQIANVRRGSIMPADLATGDDARDIAAYVARVAGQPGEDTGELAAIGASNEDAPAAVAEGGVLEIPADPSGALAFTTAKAEAEAGALTLRSVNESSVPHNIALKNGGALGEGDVVQGGGTSEVEAELKPGEYVFYCSVPGHEEGGMKGTLTVK